MDSVTITLPKDLVEKLIKPWYLMKKKESDAVRTACKNALESQ
jgi:metal-responsive CopG/Arc/MetJ family transcriptional regulator